MTHDIITLNFWNVAISGALVLVAMLLSWHLRLGLGRDMLWGAVRTFVQLTLTGYVLAFIFDSRNVWLTLLALALMFVVAIHTAQGRMAVPFAGRRAVFTAAILIGGALVLAFVTALVLRISPWYDPRYLLPLAGMIVGNAMTAVALAVDRFSGDLRRRRAEVEAALALGATPAQAVTRIRRDALRTAVMPSVNSMLVVGIVSLPGMMTGQIIAGQAPTQAVHYQIVVMYMITAAAVIASVVGVLAATRLLFTPAQQLRDVTETVK
jgi:putative ABC transport system permease protein